MAKKSSLNLQKLLDNLIDKYLLKFIPSNITPNQVTLVRFILVPIVYLLLASNQIGLAILVFIIAASTDFIDGAMARKRDQVTDLGKVIDPIADKLLILSVLIYIGFGYLIIKIFFVFIILEIIAVLFGAIFSFAIGRPTGANSFGKIKMVLQSFSVGIFMLGLSFNNSVLIFVSEKILFLALFFAILASLDNFRINIDRLKKRSVRKRQTK